MKIAFFREEIEITRGLIAKFFVNAAMGVALLFVNFPRFLTHTIDVNTSDLSLRASLHAPIEFVQACLATLIGVAPIAFFQRVMTCDFVLFWVFIALLIAFALRRTDVRLAVNGIAGILLGYVALHAISWVALSIVTLIGGAFYVVRWIGTAIAGIVVFVFTYTWPIFAVLIAVGALYGLYRFWPLIVQWLGKIAQFLLGLSAFAAALWLASFVFRALYDYILAPIGRFLAWLLTPIGHFLALVFKWALIILLSLFVLIATTTILAILGNLVVAQLLAGWYAGQGRKGVLLGGFAIGSAIALITLVAVATPGVADALNLSWSAALSPLAGATYSSHLPTEIFVGTMPESVRIFVFSHLTNIQAPAFDSFVLLMVLALGCLSVLFKLAPAEPADEPVPVVLLPTEYLMIIVGLLFSVIAIFAAAESGDSSA